MYKILEHQKALGDRGIYPFSICIFDLDHFKRVNDTFGHIAGDTVLKTVAQEVQKNLRDIDHIARYGGEEFIIILTNSGRREAMICAERVREMVKELTFENMPADFQNHHFRWRNGIPAHRNHSKCHQQGGYGSLQSQSQRQG